MVLVAIIFLGNQVVQGIFSNDNVSQFAHLIGGACGGIFGYALRPKSLKNSATATDIYKY
jgi:membrane associated rhomboid family serine protease